MKKIVISIFITIFAVMFILPLSACKKTKFFGEYRVQTLTCMGLSASQKSFSNYSLNRNETEKDYNSLYRPIQLLFSSVLTLNDNKTARLVISDFEDCLSADSHYASTIETAKNKGYIVDGNLIIENLRWSEDKSQSNSYYVYAVDQNDEYMKLSEIWGNKLFSADHIHARIRNGELACKIKICIYETKDDLSTVALTTNVTINMKI